MASRTTSDHWAVPDVLDCALCAAPMPLETAPCADGHGDECPDRMCAGCGVVVVVGREPLRTARSA